MAVVTIWKFELWPAHNAVKMPQHARILSTAFQGEQLMVWAAIMTGNPKVDHNFFVAVTGTGHERGIEGPFIGTAHHPLGLVFHVFDLGEQTTSMAVKPKQND